MNEQLLKIVQDEILKSRGSSIRRRRSGNLSVASSAWVSTARLKDEFGKAISIVLNTVGCSHARGAAGGCSMCSYLLDGTTRSPTPEQLVTQFEGAMSKLDGESAPLSVKIYTSGSFLDPEEVPPNVLERVLELIAADDRVVQVVLESRPEYVSDEMMSQIRSVLEGRDIEIGIGLESSNDDIRNICINKGFSLTDFQSAKKIAAKHGIGIRSYVLVKPPFLTERDSIVDAIKTITDAIQMGVTTVSVNPVNVQKYTLVEYLWRNREYRPPWLWSLVEILKRTHKESQGIVPIICDPVAPGKERGTHNCGKCDAAFASAIRDFSLHQDTEVFERLDCDCKKTWAHNLKHEDASNLVHATRMK
ncbi:TIGR01210 family radical SAM protein [Candidatus Thorarchaeota archaeon]|nr:MAG: TIGR01210 family radical SAM protein [Candidatus Thorarchaeota archaeon]